MRMYATEALCDNLCEQRAISSPHKQMLRHSSDARLIITNLPLMTDATPASLIVEFISTMTTGLGPTVLVRGSGNEVVTTFG